MNDQTIREWKLSGSFIELEPFYHRVFVVQIGSVAADPKDTLLLLHGFPESSFSYHKVIPGLLQRFDRIVLFDMLGYGFSDKPVTNYTYSLFEQADLALQVWNHFNIQGGHLLAHDMGDSVATELCSRHVFNLMPEWFRGGFQSATFTNGSMVLDLAKLRITQKILLSRYGHLLRKIPTYNIFKQQVLSAHGNNNLKEEDINHLWKLNTLQDGHQKTYLTIKYLNDRKRFEKTRWLPALSLLDIPIHLCWGDEDAVAKVEMAYYLKSEICPNAQLTIMEGLGHFCQLGSPEKWNSCVLAFYADKD